MAKPEMHHVKLYQSSQIWISLVMVLVLMFAGYAGVYVYFKGKFDETSTPAFVVDLRNEQYPTEIDYTSRYQIVVRIKKPDGVEMRLYDHEDGRLFGTFIEQSAAAPQPKPSVKP